MALEQGWGERSGRRSGGRLELCLDLGDQAARAGPFRPSSGQGGRRTTLAEESFQNQIQSLKRQNLIVRLEGAGETLCACGWAVGESWYWLKLDLRNQLQSVFSNLYHLLDSVPSPCGEITSGSQLFARSNIFRIMGTSDREMVLDRLRVDEGPKSVARCCSTSWNRVSSFTSSSSNLGILESWMQASPSPSSPLLPSSSSGVAGCSLVSGLLGRPGHSSSFSSSASCSWIKVCVWNSKLKFVPTWICWEEEKKDGFQHLVTVILAESSLRRQHRVHGCRLADNRRGDGRRVGDRVRSGSHHSPHDRGTADLRWWCWEGSWVLELPLLCQEEVGCSFQSWSAC